MPVSAAVVNLSQDAVERRSALDRLAEDSRVTLGPRQGLYLPVVVTTETIDAGIAFVDDELPSISGIRFVRVVRVDFDDAPEAMDATSEAG